MGYSTFEVYSEKCGRYGFVVNVYPHSYVEIVGGRRQLSFKPTQFSHYYVIIVREVSEGLFQLRGKGLFLWKPSYQSKF